WPSAPRVSSRGSPECGAAPLAECRVDVIDRRTRYAGWRDHVCGNMRCGCPFLLQTRIQFTFDQITVPGSTRVELFQQTDRTCAKPSGHLVEVLGRQFAHRAIEFEFLDRSQ